MKPETITTLQVYGLSFSRIHNGTYGAIGKLVMLSRTVVVIFAETFYVHEDMFPLNASTLAAIKDIQESSK